MRTLITLLLGTLVGAGIAVLIFWAFSIGGDQPGLQFIIGMSCGVVGFLLVDRLRGER